VRPFAAAVSSSHVQWIDDTSAYLLVPLADRITMDAFLQSASARQALADQYGMSVAAVHNDVAA